MQIGTKIWAIDPMKSNYTGEVHFTVGKDYEIEKLDTLNFYVKCNSGEVKGVLKSLFGELFSLTPPEGKGGDDLEILRHAIEAAKYLAWDMSLKTEGGKKAAKIFDDFHNGMFGSKEGMWVQVEKALKSIENKLKQS